MNDFSECFVEVVELDSPFDAKGFTQSRTRLRRVQVDEDPLNFDIYDGDILRCVSTIDKSNGSRHIYFYDDQGRLNDYGRQPGHREITADGKEICNNYKHDEPVHYLNRVPICYETTKED